VRRLFSTFAHGAPGVGLLLLRLAAGVLLIDRAVSILVTAPPFASAALESLLILLGVLLLVGLWTPVAGGVVALVAMGEALSHSASWQQCVLIGIVGVALTLLGPGAWSVDARLYGWRQIKISDSHRDHDPSA
jgi:uncharacterized membrane protein YphA (DoxX/SURF4 family)